MKNKKTNKFSLITIAIYSAFQTAYSLADLPTNGQIRAGQAEISQNNGAMTIQQNTPKVSIDWDSFNIGNEKSVEFKQPTTSSVAYNRVTGGNARKSKVN